MLARRIPPKWRADKGAQGPRTFVLLLMVLTRIPPPEPGFFLCVSRGIFGITCGLLGARHNIFGACQIERRPRGASRDKPAPTFVSGQSFLCKVGCSLVEWLEMGEEQLRPSISNETNKADRGEFTEVTGPKQMWERACPAKRRAGGARSDKRQRCCDRHLVALAHPPPSNQLTRANGNKRLKLAVVCSANCS